MMIWIAGSLLLVWGLANAASILSDRIKPRFPPLPLISLLPIGFLLAYRIRMEFSRGGLDVLQESAQPLKVQYMLYILLPALAWFVCFSASAVFLASSRARRYLATVLFVAMFLETLIAFLEIIQTRTGLPTNLIQFLSETEIEVGGQIVKERIFGTIGNPNWVAGFLAVSLVTLVGWVMTLRSSGGRMLIGLALLLSLFVMVSARSKGAVLALLVGLAHYGVGSWLLRRKPGVDQKAGRKTLKRAFPILVVAVMVVVGSAVWMAQKRSPMAGGSYLERWAETLALRGDSITIRALLAHLGFRMWEDQPWIGLGPGEFKLQFLESLKELVEEPGSDRYRQRVARLHSLRASHLHNEYLQTLVEWGVVGLVFLELFLVWCQIRAFRWLRAEASANSRTIRLATLSGFWAGLGGSFFDYPFHRPAQAFLLAVLLGASIAPIRSLSSTEPDTKKSHRLIGFLLGLLFILVGLFSLWQSSLRYAAQREAFWGKSLWSVADADKSLALGAIQRARRLVPAEGEYDVLLARYQLDVENDPRAAVSTLRKARRLSDSPDLYFLEARAQFARNNLTEAANRVWFLETLDPDRVGLNYLKGRLLQDRGEWREACAAYLGEIQASDARPDHPNPFLEESLLRVASILETQLEGYAEAAGYYEEFLRRLGNRIPTYPEARMSLGRLYRDRFYDLDKAEKYFKEALEIFRGHSMNQEAREVDEILTDIQKRRRAAL